MRRTLFTLLFCTLFLALALACASPQPETTEEAAAAEHGDGVAWFEGSPDEAFAYAKAEGKPLFLYWGAEWCPPCHYLKDKIFAQPDFVARSRDFVAVYLDGDDAGAQTLGEQLDVQGYPTVMVYSADGDELLRMPHDVPVSRYAGMMERALQLDRPIKDILDSVMDTGPAAADPADLDVLAYYSWGQDSQVALEDEARLATFERLWAETPAALVGPKARFLGLYLSEAAHRARNEEEVDPLEPQRRVELREAALALLADPALRRENVIDVTFRATGTIELLAQEPGDERAALIAAWRDAVHELERDEELSTNDRLWATKAVMDLARLELGGEDPALPEDVVSHVREEVARAVDEVEDGSGLQTVLNTATALLTDAGLADEAQTLLAERLDEAEAPYYFMSYLAALKREAGETDEALELYRQAWESARGRYTRFRWGTTYLGELMDLAPDGVETIESASSDILDELLTHDDAFALGNSLRLGQLERAYTAWAEEGDRAAAVERIRDRVSAACERYPAEGEDSQRARCEAWLSETPTETA